MMSDPKADLHYPKETADFLAWFRSDVDWIRQRHRVKRSL
jgi:hypothetical protein